GDVASQILGKTDALADRTLERPAAPGPGPRLVSRAHGDYFEVRPDGAPSWRPIFVEGVNLGAALPGRYPAEFPRDKALYADWLDKMSGLGANVVRLYTLFPPEFYQALRDHNDAAGASHRLWLVQGVWTELPDDDAYDNPAFRAQFFEEID